jgi:hypothetical protein
MVFKKVLNAANDFRARLRFPRVAREPPPAGVFVLHSNQPLEQAKNYTHT